MRAGAAPDSPEALHVMEEQYRGVAQYWTPDRTSYANLGQMYIDNPGFKARYDAKASGLAGYLRDATAEYASQRLSRPGTDAQAMRSTGCRPSTSSPIRTLEASVAFGPRHRRRGCVTIPHGLVHRSTRRSNTCLIPIPLIGSVTAPDAQRAARDDPAMINH
jgi:hypothetical protein